MDIKTLDSIIKDISVSGIDDSIHLNEMIVNQRQAGEDAAKMGEDFENLYSRYELLPSNNGKETYPESELEQYANKIRDIVT